MTAHELTAETVAAASLVVGIDSVRPHPRNANKGSVGIVRESLRAHGQYRALVVQKSTGYVLAGNTTWKAAKEEGHATVAVTELDVTDDQALRILLVDNRSAQLGDGYDDQLLAELLGEVQRTEDWAGTGWAEVDLDELLEEMGSAFDPSVPGVLGAPDLIGSAPPGSSGSDDPLGGGVEAPGSAFQVTVRFAADEDAEAFFALLGAPRTGFMWWPAREEPAAPDETGGE